MKEYICNNCGYIVEPVKTVRGNFATEIILWFFFLIPGLCYTVWRVSGKDIVCPSCNSNQIIPADSPKGQKLALKAKKYEVVNVPIWKNSWLIITIVVVVALIVIGQLSQGS